MNIQTKTKQKAPRKFSRKPRILAFRDSHVGKECPQCEGTTMTSASAPGKDPCSVTIEHVQPVDEKHGGADNMSNLKIICSSCQCARNQLKQFFENCDDILPDKFWYASIRHKNPKYLRILIDIYPKEWGKLRELLSVKEQKKKEFLRRGE